MVNGFQTCRNGMWDKHVDFLSSFPVKHNESFVQWQQDVAGAVFWSRYCTVVPQDFWSFLSGMNVQLPTLPGPLGGLGKQMVAAIGAGGSLSRTSVATISIVSVSPGTEKGSRWQLI